MDLASSKLSVLWPSGPMKMFKVLDEPLFLPLMSMKRAMPYFLVVYDCCVMNLSLKNWMIMGQSIWYFSLIIFMKLVS